MAIVIEDAQVERLAEQLASAEGVSVAEVVRESLFSLANLRGLTARKPALRERLAILAREVDAVPRCPADAHSDNQLLGYNEHGIW
ncbi:MAG TPA: type II toxin-antitoxin system VapB family antitoxin [Candidatus Angelobacter sp.]|jgi:hypothetical protein|nr:type II toxin-antitoxin system VapB family antitoxin [Candidatus Angelobacter sp.]